jgi:hypothetical protein
MPRVTARAAIVLMVLICWAPPARADTTGSAITDRSGIGEQAGVDVVNGGHSEGPAPRCVDVPVRDLRDGVGSVVFPTGDVISVKVSPPAGRATGTWYAKWCGTGEFDGFFFIGTVNTVALADEAWKRLTLPLPQPELSPAGDQIVNLPSWLWLAGPWAPLSSTVSVPGVRVTAVAVPEQAVWTMGDGGQVVCDGPGVAYDAAIRAAAPTPSCAYTYTSSSATRPDLRFHAAVTVRWHATWSASGVTGGGDLGTIDRTTVFSVRVGEVQALNTAVR